MLSTSCHLSLIHVFHTGCSTGAGGNAYNQLAVLASYESDDLAAAFFYIRCGSCCSLFLGSVGVPSSSSAAGVAVAATGSNLVVVTDRQVDLQAGKRLLAAASRVRQVFPCPNTPEYHWRAVMVTCLQGPGISRPLLRGTREPRHPFRAEPGGMRQAGGSGSSCAWRAGAARAAARQPGNQGAANEVGGMRAGAGTLWAPM